MAESPRPSSFSETSATKLNGRLTSYERKIEAAKLDLAHVNATLRMFEAPEGRTEFPIYVDTLRLFRRGEIVAICKRGSRQRKGRSIHANWLCM